MKNELMVFKIGRRFFIVAIVLFTIGLFFPSCSNKKNEKSEEKAEKKDSTTAAEELKAPLPPLSAGPFAVVRLTQTDLINCFSDPQTHKLLIQFRDDNVDPRIVATAYGAVNGTTKETFGPVNIDAFQTGSWKPTGPFILGN